ncbi:MAG: aa3-type cytochrome oxidase subunit II [Mycobacterium sp.]
MTSRGQRVVGTAAVFTVLAVVLSGCSWSEVAGLGWPMGITPESHDNRELWVWSLVASLVVGVIVWALIFWTAAFHRRKDTDSEFPRQFGYNMPLEIVLTIVPFVIIAVLFYFTVVVQERMLNKEPDPDLIIDVTAFQWNWKFGYQQINFADQDYVMDLRVPDPEIMESAPDGTDQHGNAEVGPVRGMNPEDRTYLQYDSIETLGTSDEIPVLVLPVGKRIEFVLNSADVIHGFWVPEFLFKRDVMPEPEANDSDNVFQVSEIMEEGAFVGRCTEMCGTYHSMMNFEIRVVTVNNFMAYMDNRLAGMTNAEALVAIDEEPLATTTHPFDTRRQMAQASK